MAVWQFDIALVPVSALAADPNLFANSKTPDGLETSSWWTDYPEKKDLDGEIGEILPKGKSWHDDLSAWGDEDGSRIDVWRDKGALDSISIRIDANTPDSDFLRTVCDLAVSIHCKFYGYESHSLIEPDVQSLANALRKSGASKFVADPQRYLTEIAESADN